MTTNPACLHLTPESLHDCLQTEAIDLVRTVEGELTLDFSSIPRIDAGTVRALEALAAAAGPSAVSIRLRSVNIEVYKTLMLLKLVRQFTFAG